MGGRADHKNEAAHMRTHTSLSTSSLTSHTGEKQTKSPIYSISVHPDGTRLATGGQGMSVVHVW